MRAALAPALGLALAAALASCAGNTPTRTPGFHETTARQPPRAVNASGGHAPAAPRRGQGRSPSSLSGLVLHLRDPTRTIVLPDGTRAPRTLLTYVRYPAARSGAPFPLIVFGHGFDITPAPYARLLRSWARAGYVVAAPVFPRASPKAPGGPSEADLPNQPADMSFAITRLLAAGRSRSGPLHGLIDPRRIAVAGQSDGGDTALAAAYDPRFRDRRIDATVILSGAEIPGLRGFRFPRAGPPLLAVQGSADTINLPAETTQYFDAAPRPKYLLALIGAQHLPPYTTQQPQLGIVERVSTAFLDAYLRGQRSRLASLRRLAGVRGAASLLAEP